MAAKFLLVAALLHFAAAKVVYKYEGQAIIGSPESGRDFNVLRIEFNIAASKIDGTSDVLVQVDPSTIRAHNYSGYLFPIPEGIISPEKFTELVSNDAVRANLATQMAKPLVVSRDENGTISNIRHDATDAFWSVNIKKGALSLIQLNVQTDDGVYTVQESDITGNCPSTYLVQSREHYYGNDRSLPTFLNITKSRDYSKCTNRTILRHSFFSGFNLNDQEFAEKNIISNAKFAYNITGTKSLGAGLLIDSATSEAQHIFTIFKPLSGSLAVITHQRAQLLSRDSDQGALPSNLLSCPWDFVLPNVLTASTDYKFQDSEVLGDIRAATAKLIDPQQPAYIRAMMIHRIIERMRGARLSAWESVGNAAKATGNKDYIKLLMDLAPSAGTLESLQKFQEYLPQLTPNITSQFFALTSMFGEPTFQMITTLQSICESAPVRETFRETKACVLALGSMFYNRYYRSGYVLQNASFPADELNSLTTFGRKVLGYYDMSMAGNISTQLLWVKFAGNLGSPLLIDQLKAIANNESVAIVVRVHAIRAFRRMPVYSYKQIQDILLPIFTNWRHDVEIRLAAYRGLIATKPSQSIIDLIATALHYEHQEHIRKYVYTHLKTLTKNPHIDDIPLSDRARVALEGLTAMIPLGLQYSHYQRVFDSYDEERNAGFTVDVSLVSTGRTLVPREACIWIRGIAFGVQTNVMHACLRLQGVQKVLQRLMRKGAPVFPEFFAELNLNQVEFEDYHGLVDVSFEGSEIQYLEIPNFISKALENPSETVATMQRLIGYLRTRILKTVAFDSTLQIPSLLGLPVQSNHTYVTHLNFSLGEFSLVPACRFNPYQPCQVTLQPIGTYQIGSQHSLGIDTGVVQSKILLHGAAGRFRGEYRNWTISYLNNGQNSSLSFEAKLPTARTSTLRTELIPLLVTVNRLQPFDQQFYIRDWNAWHSSVLPDANWEFSLNTTARATGFLLGINKTYTRCLQFPLLPANKPTDPFCGRVYRDFYVIPQPGAPDSVKITLNRYGPVLADASSSTFRSNDEFGVARHTADEDMDGFEHDMMADLSKLSRHLNEEAAEIEAIREELSEMEDSQAVEVEAEENLDDDDTILVRRRRSVYKPGRKDRKPGVSQNRHRKPASTSDDDSDIQITPPKQEIKSDSTYYSIDVSGLVNGQEQRKLSFNWKRTPTDKKKQWQREFTFAATINQRQVASVCGKALVQYPTGHVTLLPEQGDFEEPSWTYSAKVQYGSESCDPDKSFEVILNLTRSDEQKQVTQLFRSRSPAVNKWYLAAMCNDEVNKGYSYTWPCRHFFATLNDGHQFQWILKAHDLKKLSIGGLDLRAWISMLFLRARVMHWQDLRTSFTRDFKHDSKQISAISTRNFQLPYLMDITLTTPESLTEFRKVHVMHPAFSMYLPSQVTMLYHMSGFRLPGICVAHKSAKQMYVSTFDNVVYNTTQPACPDSAELNILFAADCSPSSKFAVYGNYKAANKFMEIRILTAAHSLTIRPSLKGGAAEAYLDDKQITDEKYTISSEDSKLTVVTRSKVLSAMFDIGLVVTVTPDFGIMIGASPLYGGLTCGLCGDYNGQSIDEYTLADGTLTDDSLLFQRSYIAGLQQCSA